MYWVGSDPHVRHNNIPRLVKNQQKYNRNVHLWKKEDFMNLFEDFIEEI